MFLIDSLRRENDLGPESLRLMSVAFAALDYLMQYQNSVELKLMQQFVKNLRFTANYSLTLVPYL